MSLRIVDGDAHLLEKRRAEVPGCRRPPSEDAARGQCVFSCEPEEKTPAGASATAPITSGRTGPRTLDRVRDPAPIAAWPSSSQPRHM